MIKSEKNKHENCWEYINCPLDMRKQCLAYTSDTTEDCWILNQVGEKKDKSNILSACKSCPWFLMNNR
jgi:hypothetical protein